MTDFDYYCRHCDFFLSSKDGQVHAIDENDPKCEYCNRPVQSEPDPNEGSYDTLDEKRL